MTRRRRATGTARLRRIAELNSTLTRHRGPALFGALIICILFLAWRSALERYITPEYGTGYALGIIGGSMMLALLIYPLRKRFRSLNWLGPARFWFRTHMILGILGPSLILLHCNFSWGATNSNIALLSMLIVATSGIVGRYFYSRIHRGLYGAKVQLQALRQDAELARRGLQSLFENVTGLRDVIDDFDRLAVDTPRGVGASAAHMIRMAASTHLAQRAASRRVHKYLQSRNLDPRSRVQIQRKVDAFLRVYLDAVRRVAETSFYERLFSRWHVLHLPLFIMLIVTATFHIIAVHVY